MNFTPIYILNLIIILLTRIMFQSEAFFFGIRHNLQIIFSHWMNRLFCRQSLFHIIRLCFFNSSSRKKSLEPFILVIEANETFLKWNKKKHTWTDKKEELKRGESEIRIGRIKENKGTKLARQGEGWSRDISSFSNARGSICVVPLSDDLPPR